MNDVIKTLKARHLATYDYSLLKPISGKVKVKRDEAIVLECDSLLFVDPSGQPLIVLEDRLGRIELGVSHSLTGTLEYGATFTAKKVIPNLISCSSNRNPLVHCEIWGKLNIKYRPWDFKASVTVKQICLNLFFSHSECVGKSRLSQMTVQLDDYRHTITRMGSNDEKKQRMRLLKDSVVLSLPTAEISTDGVESLKDLNVVLKHGQSICRIVTMACGTQVASPGHIISVGNEIVEQSFSSPMITSFCKQRLDFALLDSFETRGVQRVLKSSILKYLENEDSYNLSHFIGYVAHARNANYPEIRLTLIILALESLLTGYLKDIEGMNQSQVENMSIISKLRRFNTHHRFIESRYTGDSLRKDIRNPLFHTGVIHTLNGDQAWNAFWDLYVLANQIFLKVVGYCGVYRPGFNSHDTTAVPWAACCKLSKP